MDATKYKPETIIAMREWLIDLVKHEAGREERNKADRQRLAKIMAARRSEALAHWEGVEIPAGIEFAVFASRVRVAEGTL